MYLFYQVNQLLTQLKDELLGSIDASDDGIIIDVPMAPGQADTPNQPFDPEVNIPGSGGGDNILSIPDQDPDNNPDPIIRNECFDVNALNYGVTIENQMGTPCTNWFEITYGTFLQWNLG